MPRIPRSLPCRPHHAIIDSVAQLLVRNLDEDLVRALQIRAAENGRSAEAEHREILKAVLGKGSPAVDFKTFLESMPGGDDHDLVVERGPARDVDL
jgi:antitoxin FitA